MKRGFIILTVVAVAAMLLAGCAVSGTPSPTPSQTTPGPMTQPPSAEPSTGTIRVLVTDAPSITVTKAMVSFSEVWFHRVDGQEGDGGWIKLGPEERPGTFEEGEIDLALLRDAGAAQLLADADIPVGWYNQIRVILNEGAGVTVDYTLGEGDDAVSIPGVSATLPSGKLRFVHPSFQVVEDEDTEIVLDFDLAKSVVVTGPAKENPDKVIFKPVVKLLITAPTSEETSTSVETSGLSLQIIEPEVDAESQYETDATSLIIEGSVSDPAATVTVNHEPATVDEDTGAFSHEVQLSPGDNTIEIAAELGDEEVMVAIIVYTPED